MKQSELYTTAQNFANKDIQQQLWLAGKDEKKEETIEEAAKTYILSCKCQLAELDNFAEIITKLMFKTFSDGANWQKEHTKLGMVDLSKDLQKLIESEREQRWITMKVMYTEEEALKLILNAICVSITNPELFVTGICWDKDKSIEWFEQNKKK